MRVRAGCWLMCVVSMWMGFGALAQGTGVRSGWQQVEALPPQTKVHVRTDHRKVTCRITSASDEQLVCSGTSLARTEIVSVKVARSGRSTLEGTLIGAGVGVGVGAGIGVGVKSAFWESSSGKAAGVGAAVFGIVGLGVGALIGHATDFGAQTVYRR